MGNHATRLGHGCLISVSKQYIYMLKWVYSQQCLIRHHTFDAHMIVSVCAHHHQAPLVITVIERRNRPDSGRPSGQA